MKRLLPVIIALFALVSCEDIIELDLKNPVDLLVVDGWITDQGTIDTVRLTRTASFTDDNPNPVVNDAIVVVTSDFGETDTLDYTVDGKYVTSSIFGTPGRTYELYVKLNDGKEYRSLPEYLDQVGDFDSLSILKNVDIEGGGDLLQPGIYPVVDYLDPPGEDYYRWKIFYNGVEDKSPGSILVEDDGLLLGDTVYAEGRPIITSPFEEENENDTITIQYTSITANAYNFFLLLQSQVTLSGSPFDSPPAPIKGNMYNVSDSEEIVLGFFGVTSIKEKTAVYQE